MLRVYINPSRSDLTAILRHTPDLRGVGDDRNFFFFSALASTHVQAERALMASALIARDAYPIETIFLCRKDVKLSPSYGKPRPFDDQFSMYCENRWKAVMSCPNFARLMQRPVVKESVDSETFRRWFRNSKIVDEQGKPLIVYHGTNQSFEKFSHDRLGMSTGANAGAMHGFFFTNSVAEADQYAVNAGSRVVANIDAFEKEQKRLTALVAKTERDAQRTGNWEPYERAMEAWEKLEIDATQEDEMVGHTILHLYLSIQNPAVINFNSTNISSGEEFEDLIVDAKTSGHDGLILKDIVDSPKGGLVTTQFVIFNANQVKAVANIGTYDPADDRFHH